MTPKKIRMTTVRLQWREPIGGPPKPHLLRGAIANAFPDEPLFHQHSDKGFLYRYPLIQYRWRGGEGILAGFEEGAATLARVPFNDLPLMLGGNRATVMNAEISCREEIITVSPRLLRYRFVAPWLPFNQDTYEPYLALDEQAKRYERDRLAVANLLLLLKGLGIRIDERLYAIVEVRKTVSCRYKDQTMLGFLGSFVTNVDLPNGVAIGRAVSHGFGWLERD